MEATHFYLQALRKFSLRQQGTHTHSNLHGTGGVNAQTEYEMEQLPVVTTYLTPLRNPVTGERLYPADYMPAGVGPAQ